MISSCLSFINALNNQTIQTMLKGCQKKMCVFFCFMLKNSTSNCFLCLLFSKLLTKTKLLLLFVSGSHEAALAINR